MSVSTAQSRQKRDILSAPSPRKDSSLNELGHHSSLKLHLKLDMSECENDDPLLRSAGKIRDLNCTYVLSACKTPRDMPLTPNPVGKLTLQRRVTKNKDSSLLGSKVEESTENVTETPLTLRRCARTGSVGKGTTARNVAGVAGSHCASQETSTNAEMVSNENSTLVPPSVPPAKDTALIADEKYRETFSALSGAEDSVTLQCLSHSTPIRSQSQAEAHSGHLATKRLQSKLDIEVSGTGNLHHRSTGKDTVKNTNTLESLEKKTPTKYTSGHKLTPRCGTPQFKSPAASTLRHRTPSFQVKQKPKSSLLTNKREKQQEHTLPPKEEMAVQSASPERDPLKAENSQVTVAVRVRPFSKREKAENAPQVVFLSGEEIAVRHPDMRHVYHFTYDMSFWSFDERHPQHASQATVYETLAAPLLAGALEGYNTCLFAYGQTGSGKSYTMMGFGEEPGIIPRFCEDLFAQVAKKQTQEVRYHLEMSFFEVYNEKIHDLLVYKGENGQRKQALRVREHPVSGPYVEGLAVNVVSSYSDVQGWLELGAKQRATATTSMNDKSSRSHAVLTLVATRTQTEFVDGEEHDHRITSRINLVDLAGSERCGPACASGQQLKEGVSINRSLLTLGKVISALAEHGHRRGVFIPYRESVLTWLLKESLGGNSKTAMIATVSPAASSVEETLSTLRYALQARSIVNVARVNEDMSAQLIRELKAEIEKLKAAQRSRQNIDPERYSLCRREITSLRMKLHQQERDMAEMQRVWKEKFEQAEQRKHHEIQELQKAGVTFQVDNNLPNLVNLSEDPQLSEMLLYVIKEGTTTVGKCSPTSSPDIQLSGVLVADTHCSIRNVDGTVSLVPVREANTYVNGKHVLEPTVLHHGDRVVLGGDHYFRFNHPAEVQKRRRPTGGDVLTSEGPKDFDFAKNELLKAQRSQLEAEVREAQLRAKQEMLQGVQIAREMAEQELSSQRAAYESRIEALEAELKEESQRKRVQEISNQKAAHRIEELEKAKQRLEQEVHTSRKRLEVESLAAKQALEDHSIRHTRILEALEAEKQKIAKEVQILQHNQSNRDKTCTRPATVTGNEYLIFQIDIDNEFYPSKEASDRILVISLTEQSRKYTGWHSLRLSVMVQEANAISHKFRRGYVFSRHQTSDEGDGSDPCVRVRDLRLGISTLWSLEKFEYKLAAMKELYESNCSDRGEDPFCDPEDEWEPDITDAPVSSFSRRRSRSLVRNRRVSGYLHDVRARSGQNAPPSRSSGVFYQSFEEETVVDSLVDSFLRVHHGLLAISQAHEDQDEDSQDDLFSSDRAAQAQAVQVACAFAQLVVLARHWPADLPPGAARLGEELRREVTTLGGSLQLFLQGCCSGLSAVVKEAQEKVAQTVQRALKYAGQFAVLHGDKLRLLEGRGNKGAGVQEDFMAALWDGMGSGMRVLFDSGIEKAGELRRELLRQHPHGEVAQQLSANAMALVGSLENIFAEWKARSFRTQAQETSGCQDLKKMIDYAPELLKLKLCLEETIQIVLSALRGCHGDGNLRNCVESICSLARGFLADGIVDTTSFDSCDKSHRDLESAAKSLLLCFESEERPHLLKPWDTCNQNGREGPRLSRASRTGPGREKGVPKHVYELPSCPQQSSLGCAPSRTQWV